jgi:hypothetical protein
MYSRLVSKFLTNNEPCGRFGDGETVDLNPWHAMCLSRWEYGLGDAMVQIGPAAIFLDAPVDRHLIRLFQHWDAVRAGRAMPSLQDIYLASIANLLPRIFIYKASSDRTGHILQLVGQELVRFVGRDLTGRPAGSMMPPYSAALISKILDTVVAKRAPRFRAGKTHWHKDKPHRSFEACFLPLSNDGKTVNLILGALVVA